MTESRSISSTDLIRLIAKNHPGGGVSLEARNVKARL